MYFKVTRYQTLAFCFLFCVGIIFWTNQPNLKTTGGTHGDRLGRFRIENIPNLEFPPDFFSKSELNRTLLQLEMWSEDTDCGKHQVKLLPDGYRSPVPYVSYPGSGNTWIGQLVMGLTGVFVGSAYPQDNLFKSRAGVTYEVPVNCNCTILTKTHMANEERDWIDGDHGVFLIRDPFKAIMSFRNLKVIRSTQHTLQGMAPERSFHGQAWNKFVESGIKEWESLAMSRIVNLRRDELFFYEDFVEDTEAQLRRLAALLGFRSVDEDRLQCVLKHLNDNVTRNVKKTGFHYPKNRNVYSVSQQRVIWEAIGRVNTALRSRNLPDLPVDKYLYKKDQLRN